MDDFFDDLLDQQPEPEVSKKEEPTKKEPEVETPKCDHPELWQSMCLICDQMVSSYQIQGCGGIFEYREYALLGRGRNLLIRSDHSKSYLDK